MIKIFSAEGTDGTDGPTEGSTRGPRGPKKEVKEARVKQCQVKEASIPNLYHHNLIKTSAVLQLTMR